MYVKNTTYIGFFDHLFLSHLEFFPPLGGVSFLFGEKVRCKFTKLVCLLLQTCWPSVHVECWNSVAQQKIQLLLPEGLRGSLSLGLYSLPW